jgi:hypothetical protein
MERRVSTSEPLLSAPILRGPSSGLASLWELQGAAHQSRRGIKLQDPVESNSDTQPSNAITQEQTYSREDKSMIQVAQNREQDNATTMPPNNTAPEQNNNGAASRPPQRFVRQRKPIAQVGSSTKFVKRTDEHGVITSAFSILSMPISCPTSCSARSSRNRSIGLELHHEFGEQ